MSAIACEHAAPSGADGDGVAPGSVADVDRTISGGSRFPLAENPERIGTFNGLSKSGAGYFYDEVLEYRVWLSPADGARRRAGGSDYYSSFARYEAALDYSKKEKGAEAPLVLVRQHESVNEPTPGSYEWIKEERITEWQVEWLDGSHRGPTSIQDFLNAHSSKAR